MVGELDTVLLEDSEDFLGISVVFLQELFLLKSGVVASVGDWAGIVVAVERCVLHGFVKYLLINFIIFVPVNLDLYHQFE